MGKTRRTWRLARALAAGGAALAGAMAIGFVWSPGASAEQKVADSGVVRIGEGPAGAVRADIVVRQRQLRADGRLARPEAPVVALRVDRQMAQGRWRTTFTFQSTDRPVVRSGNALVPIDNPFLISRVEYDEETADARAYDRAGRRVTLPTEADRKRFGVTAAERGPGWDPKLFTGAELPRTGQAPPVASAEGLFLDSTQRDRRRLEFQRRFGGASGRVRGFDRFVQREDGVTRELLVTPTTSLPVEINTARGGALASRVQLQYAAAGSVGHVRQALRSERPAGTSTPEDLLVTDLVLTNIEVGAGGLR